MSTEVQRLVRDLEADGQLYEELAQRAETPEELAAWLRERGYGLSVQDLPRLLAGLGGELSEQELEGVAGGTDEEDALRLQMLMDRRSKMVSTLSNILKQMSSTQDTLVDNLK